MAVRSRSQSLVPNIWPGFVDALAALLMVLVFLLLIFILSQFVLNETLFQRDKSLESLNSRLSGLIEELNLARSENADLRAEIAGLGARLSSTAEALGASQAEGERLRQALTAQEALTEEERLKVEEAEAELQLLNDNILALRRRLSELAEILDESRQRDEAQQVEIVELGKKLNTALAGRAQDLARYRSEFFGRLRDILRGRDDIFIVGDRFVFRSEVLFAEASDEITVGGREQLRSVAEALRQIAGEIPTDIDWVLRVDGHTDKRPIRTVRFPSNWELSSARAISVIRFFIAEGVMAERLVAAGFGEHRPLVVGDDEDSYSRNRRIELKLTHR